MRPGKLRRFRARRGGDERGVALIQSVVLVGVIGMVVGGLAGFVVAGIRGSKASVDMVHATAAARAALDVTIDQFDHDRWAPCTSLSPLVVPSAVTALADVVTLTCSPNGTLDGHPVVMIAAQARAAGSTVTYIAELQVSAVGEGVAVLAVQRR